MMLDLRAPIGWIFIIIGTLLVLEGYLSPSATPFGELTVNLNLVWGSVMGLFGLFMSLLSLAARGR